MLVNWGHTLPYLYNQPISKSIDYNQIVMDFEMQLVLLHQVDYTDQRTTPITK